MPTPRKSTDEKAVSFHVSVPRKMAAFIEDMDVSLSKVTQDAIAAMMAEHPEYTRSAEVSDILAHTRSIETARIDFEKKHGMSIEQAQEAERKRQAEIQQRQAQEIESEKAEIDRLWGKLKKTGNYGRAETIVGLRSFVEGNIKDKHLFKIDASKVDFVCRALHELWLKDGGNS